MKVLLLFSSSELGGAERSLTRMALEAKATLDYDLSTLDGPGPWSDWCLAQGAAPIILGERRDRSRHGRFGGLALLRLIRLIRAKRYSSVYVIGLRASFWLRLAKPWLRGAALVQGVRWNPNSTSRLDVAFRWVERLLGGLIDLYICNSQAAAGTLEHLLRIAPRKICVVHNGLARIPAAIPALSHRPTQVLTIANLSPRKGYLEYLELVVAPLAERLPDVHFMLVGRDDMDGAVQRKIAALNLAQRVVHVGFQADVSAYLDASRVFVLPSLWNEGCPTSILEAMAHGLPVLAFELDGIPELINHGVNGILVPLRDHAGMLAALEQLLENPRMAQRMGESGRERVLRQFNVEHCSAAHDRIFTDLLGETAK